MAIEIQRTDEDYEALRDAAIDREIERAAAGLPPPTVSTKAAAKYLGIHFDTLGAWRRRSPPLGPPYQKGAGQSGGGANQHVRYLYSDLVAWQESRSQSSSKERRLIDEHAALERKLRELELELALRQAKEEVAKLQKKLGRIAKMESSHDIAITVHDWVVDQGLVVGHVLTVDEPALLTALDAGEVWEATVEEALSHLWVDRESREPFEEAFEGVLSGMEDRLRHAKSAQRQADLQARWGQGRDSGPRVRPLASEDL